MNNETPHLDDLNGLTTPEMDEAVQPGNRLFPIPDACSPAAAGLRSDDDYSDWTDEVPDVHPPSSEEHPRTIVVTGFWGRGNAGDEAMLQCIVEAFEPEFRIAPSLNHYGAKTGFWDWYPYKGRSLLSSADPDVFGQVPRPAGLLVGGGGLPMGCGGHQALSARARGLRTALAGIDVWRSSGTPGHPVRDSAEKWISLFDATYVRTTESLRALVRGGMGDRVGLGGDWALRVRTDTSPDVTMQPARALVVLREELPETLLPGYRELVRSLLAQLGERGFVPILLPYAPEDERMMREMDLISLAPMEALWWNPSRLKQMHANSGLTVSIGRLHPMIIAAPTGTRIATICSPLVSAIDYESKLHFMAKALGLPIYDTVGDFLGVLESEPSRAARPADRKLLNESLVRLDAQTEALRELFRGPLGPPP